MPIILLLVPQCVLLKKFCWAPTFVILFKIVAPKATVAPVYLLKPYPALPNNALCKQ